MFLNCAGSRCFISAPPQPPEVIQFIEFIVQSFGHFSSSVIKVEYEKLLLATSRQGLPMAASPCWQELVILVQTPCQHSVSRQKASSWFWQPNDLLLYQFSSKTCFVAQCANVRKRGYIHVTCFCMLFYTLVDFSKGLIQFAHPSSGDLFSLRLPCCE